MFYVKEIKLNNFRCYGSKTVTFMPKINIIYGKNAVGKTTILESIAYLGLLKSFRDAKDVDLIKNGEDFFFIKASFCETDSENKDEIIVSYNENGKKVKKNNYIYQKNSDYIGYFNEGKSERTRDYSWQTKRGRILSSSARVSASRRQSS